MDSPSLCEIWNQLPGAMLIVDAEGLVQDFNELASVRGLVRGEALSGQDPELAQLLACPGPAQLLSFQGVTREGSCTPLGSGWLLCLREADARRVVLEQRIAEQQHILDTTTAQIRVGIWSVDLASQAVTWSRETFRIYDREPGPSPTLEEVLTHYPEAAKAQVDQAIQRSIATGEAWDLELPIRTAKGREIWVRTMGRCEFRDGYPFRLLGSVQDISEEHARRQELQQALAVAREFERLFHTARAMVCVSGPDGRFQRLNQEWTRTLGWSLEELQSRSFLSFVHPADRSRTLRALAGVMETGQPTTHFENRYRHKNGGYRWLSWHSFSQAETGRFYAVALDVSGAHRTRTHQSRLALAVARTDNGVIVTDRKGRVEWVNRGFTRMTGFELEEVLGKTPGSVLQGERSAPDTIERLRTAIQAGEAFTEELVNYRKDGIPYWVQIDAQPILDDDGQVTGFMGIERDITERRYRNAELVRAKERADRAAQASAQANRAKSAFLASMSHEIRTPLNGVLGMAQLLLATELSPEQSTYVERVLGSGRTLMSLLNDILDFSKVEAGQLELNPEPYALPGLVDEVVELFEGNASAKGLSLHAEVDPELPSWLLGDSTRVRQVLFNLVSNAIKFTAEGQVTLRVDLEGEAQAPQLLLRVQDSGIGIAPDKLERIFDPFSQADVSTTRRFGGTGLGLAISRQLIGLMEGEIWVDSTLGQGACFSVQVPLIPASPVEVSVAQRARLRGPTGGLNAHVLVVEDNPVNQMVAVGMLRRLGCTTEVAANGVEAVKQFKHQSFDLVLMDWHMPEMDGLEATRVIRGLEAPGIRTPILALTANAYASQSKACLDSGMDGVITKPIVWKELADAVSGWTERLAS